MSADSEKVVTSVRARLTKKARERGDDVELAMRRFAIERLLWRLAQSPHRDAFVLKGAMLFSLWTPVPYRSTGDLDLLGRGDPAPERLAGIFRSLCEIAAPGDGLDFDATSIRTEPTRPEDEYAGVRVSLRARLGRAKLAIQVDVGFGDVVTPDAKEVSYPSVIGLPEPRLKAYPPETVVAEKLEALVSLGMRNSRMKDFFDLWAIAKTFRFEGPTLARAVAATFERRGTAIPADTPIALTPDFAEDPTKQAQWAGFVSRTTIRLAPEPLPELIAFVRGFVEPLLEEDAEKTLAGTEWTPGGPWSKE